MEDDRHLDEAMQPGGRMILRPRKNVRYSVFAQDRRQTRYIAQEVELIEIDENHDVPAPDNKAPSTSNATGEPEVRPLQKKTRGRKRKMIIVEPIEEPQPPPTANEEADASMTEELRSRQFMMKRFERKFDCAICLSVIHEPIQPSSCRHVFCSFCLYTALENNDVCPTCNTRITTLIPCNVMLQQVIDEFLDIVPELKLPAEEIQDRARRLPALKAAFQSRHNEFAPVIGRYMPPRPTIPPPHVRNVERAPPILIDLTEDDAVPIFVDNIRFEQPYQIYEPAPNVVNMLRPTANDGRQSVELVVPGDNRPVVAPQPVLALPATHFPTIHHLQPEQPAAAHIEELYNRIFGNPPAVRNNNPPIPLDAEYIEVYNHILDNPQLAPEPRNNNQPEHSDPAHIEGIYNRIINAPTPEHLRPGRNHNPVLNEYLTNLTNQMNRLNEINHQAFALFHAFNRQRNDDNVLDNPPPLPPRQFPGNE